MGKLCSHIRLLSLALLSMLSFHSFYAQMIETVDFSTSSLSFNNYVNDINNRGDICGYYTLTTGANVGFIVCADGKKITINPTVIPALSGFTDTKVTGINDHKVAVVYASNSTTNGIFKVYIDSTGDTIGHVTAISLPESTAIPYKINNLNDITGWYTGTTRYLFIYHDSIVPSGYGSWEATRYVDLSSTFYNTESGGINDANNVAGFYINGSTAYPYIYNHTSGFSLITALYSTHFWDINSSNVVCGEYKMPSGTWMAFYAPVSGTTMTLHSLSSIFYSSTIQSVANGINENGDVAGAFVHPSTGKWVGFIYHPNVSEYRIPGFNFAHNTWSMKNTSSGHGANPIWTSTYWSGASYATQDVYAGISSPPLLDSFILGMYAHPEAIGPYMNDSVSPGWKGFATEADVAGAGVSTSTLIKNYYAYILKHEWWPKYFWGQSVQNPFKGYCYGFSYTALLRYFNDPLFSSWFGIPAGTDISTITNTNTAAVMAIERFYLKQNYNDPTFRTYPTSNFSPVTIWQGLYRLKTTYQQPLTYCRPRAVGISFTGSGFHSVLPYKIRTPRILPFDYPSPQYDSVFVYDSNYPGDSSQVIRVKSSLYDPSHDSVWDASYSLAYLSFNKPAVQDFYPLQHVTFKTTSGAHAEAPDLTFSLGQNLYYTISDTGSAAAVLNGSGFTNTSPNLFPAFTEEIGGGPNPTVFNMDTGYSVSIVTSHYGDSSMHWSQTNTNRSITLSRNALPSESDHMTMKNRFISYGNHDAATKTLTGAYTESTSDMSMGSSIMVSGICANTGDSIVTKNPYPFAYQVIRVVGTGACTYTLTVYADYNDTIKEFNAIVPMNGTVSHTIDPYYVGPTGLQTVIYVDSGLTGTISDTLFVASMGIRPVKPVANAVRVHPNPVFKDNMLSIDITSSDPDTYDVMLTDLMGRVVYHTSQRLTSGTIGVPMHSFAAGTYILQVTGNTSGVVYHDKIVKE